MFVFKDLLGFDRVLTDDFCDVSFKNKKQGPHYNKGPVCVVCLCAFFRIDATRFGLPERPKIVLLKTIAGVFEELASWRLPR